MNTALPQNYFPLDSRHAASSVLATDAVGDPAARAEAAYAGRVVARLDQNSRELPYDVTERLRFARDLALQKARLARVAEAAASVSTATGAYGAYAAYGSAATLSAGGASGHQGPGKRWWMRVAAVVPLLALVGGLVFIQRLHVAAQIRAAADIDAALLADDLPPAAYADPAFAEFLRAPRD